MRELAGVTCSESDAHLQILCSLVDGVEGVIGAGVVTFVWMDEQTEPPVAFFDCSSLGIMFHTHDAIGICLDMCIVKHPACSSSLSNRLAFGLV